MNTVMIVEDDVLYLKALETLLQQYGYHTIGVLDGKEAVRILEANTQISLLITDLMLPFVGGLELVTLIRKRYGNKVPVMVLSATNTESTVLKSFELGVDDYIRKPVQPRELVVRINRLLQ